MLQFLQLLMATMQGNHISVVVFFNGAVENKRFRNWAKDEVSYFALFYHCNNFAYMNILRNCILAVSIAKMQLCKNAIMQKCV